MAEGKLFLRTFIVSVEGTQQTLKAENPNTLMREYEAMGYDIGDIKILKEITPAGSSPIKQEEQSNTPMGMLNVDDLPENMRKQVSDELKNASTQDISHTINRRIDHTHTTPITSKIWKDGRNEYKLENTILYKKAWIKTSLKKLEDECNIRVRFRTTDDIKLKTSEYVVEIMTWTEVEQV